MQNNGDLTPVEGGGRSAMRIRGTNASATPRMPSSSYAYPSPWYNGVHFKVCRRNARVLHSVDWRCSVAIKGADYSVRVSRKGFKLRRQCLPRLWIACSHLLHCLHVRRQLLGACRRRLLHHAHDASPISNSAHVDVATEKDNVKLLPFVELVAQPFYFIPVCVL